MYIHLSKHISKEHVTL